MPRLERYAYRSFDRQYGLIDGRLGDFLRPELWRASGPRQVYLASLFTNALTIGPALTCASIVPDLHYFRGSFGAADVMPLFRDSDGRVPNIHADILRVLGADPFDVITYVYGVLAQPEFTERFGSELEKREIRVPLSKDPDLFKRAAILGRRLLWLHTYGERFIDSSDNRPQGPLGTGRAKCTKAVSTSKDKFPAQFRYDADKEQLVVGDGVFEPVSREVYEFEVSGLKVVQSWLGYRMRDGKGRKSSPLDDIRPETWPHQFTTELLELLWMLEETLKIYPAQAELLAEILDGPLFAASDFPEPPGWMRKPPSDGSQPEQATLLG